MEPLQPSFSTSVRADNEGNWLQGVEDQLTPGMHRIIATDEQGNQDQALLYVVKQEPGVIQQVTAWIPPYIGWLVVSLIAAMLILGAYAIRLGQLANAKKDIRQKQRRLTHAMGISLCLIILALGASYMANKKTEGQLLKPIVQTQQAEIAPVDVRGILRQPFSGQGIAGVDLQAGKTSIRTGEGGAFQFSGINQYAGIKITHPQLKIALRKALTGKDMDIPFDPSIYNALFDLMQREVRGRILAQDGPAIFGPQDQNSQELRIGSIFERKAVQLSAGQQLTDALLVELWSGEKTKTCYFKRGGTDWQLMECR